MRCCATSPRLHSMPPKSAQSILRREERARAGRNLDVGADPRVGPGADTPVRPYDHPLPDLRNVPGLRQNWRQFTLLVVVNAFVGGMVGLERAVLPLVAEQEFGVASKRAMLAFIVS